MLPEGSDTGGGGAAEGLLTIKKKTSQFIIFFFPFRYIISFFYIHELLFIPALLEKSINKTLVSYPFNF